MKKNAYIISVINITCYFRPLSNQPFWLNTTGYRLLSFWHSDINQQWEVLFLEVGNGTFIADTTL